jgi:hypothetical protein
MPSLIKIDYLGRLPRFIAQGLVKRERAQIPFLHEDWRTFPEHRWCCKCAGDSAGRSRTVGRYRLAGAGSTGPARGQLIKFERAAVALLTVLTLVSCTDASAATPTKKKAATTRRKVGKKPSTTKRRTTATKKVVSTTVTPTTGPTLSAEAKAVLDGYEAYLQAYVAGSREPERAAELYAKGMTGDALARLIEIANFDVTNGQYWDGKRADIVSKGRVETIGETRSTMRDCRSVGGVVRKRSTNAAIPGTSGADVDDLFIDLVKIDGRWVVTRTDRSNQEEGKATCVPGSSP